MMTARGSEPVLLDNDRLATVSSIIGTIAHDFNNLLTPFLAYPQLIKSDLPEGSSGMALLDVMEKAAKDMVHITQQLLDLSAKDRDVRKPVHVNNIVSSVLSQLKDNGSLPAGLPVHTALEPDLVLTSGCKDQLIRALYNIMINAVEAVGSQGVLSIRTENVKIDAGVCATGLPYEKGEYVRITITDNGPGMEDSVKCQIFNPFFTTKKGGIRRGAGLGLSIAYRVIKNHGGFIDFESAPGKGADFRVYLPVSKDMASVDTGIASVTKPEKSVSPVKCNKNRILLVDDEKTILKLFQMIISSALPDVTIDVANNGEEALKVFSEKRPCVLVMDLHMPVMDGQAAFFKLNDLSKEQNWDMPSVVFCTGFAPPDSIRSVIESDPRHCLLSKPVSGDTIVEAVSSRLLK